MLFEEDIRFFLIVMNYLFMIYFIYDMILKHDLLGFSPLLNTLMLEETVGSSFRCYIQSLPTLRPRMAKFARRGLQGSGVPTSKFLENIGK